MYTFDEYFENNNKKIHHTIIGNCIMYDVFDRLQKIGIKFNLLIELLTGITLHSQLTKISKNNAQV